MSCRFNKWHHSLWRNLYETWQSHCFYIGFFSFVILMSFSSHMSLGLLLVWLQFPSYLLQEFEEHVFPGNFKKFIHENISQQLSVHLSSQYVFWTNILVIWVGFPMFALLSQHVTLKIGPLLPIFTLFNASTHIGAGLFFKKYNPGLFVSIFINYPLGFWCLWVLFQEGVLTWMTGGMSLLTSLLVHGILVFCAQSKKEA